MVDKKTLLNEYKFSTILGISTAIFLVLAILIGQALVRSMINSQSDLKQKKQVHVKLDEKLNNLKKLSEKIKDLKDKSKKVTSAFPNDNDLARLLVQFESIANENGLSIDRISESGGSGDDSKLTTTGLKEIGYQMTGISLNYDTAKNTLEKLYTALRVMSVVDVSVSPTDDQGSNPGQSLYSLSIRLKTYVRSQ